MILLRHGDKVTAGDGNDNLSANGFLRSINLGRLIPACFGAPTHIRTFFLNPETSKNARSYQSAVPLGVASGVHISPRGLFQAPCFRQAVSPLPQVPLPR